MYSIYKCRNGNEIAVKHSKCGHYYIALITGNKKVTAWLRKSLKFINSHYTNLNVERVIL